MEAAVSLNSQRLKRLQRLAALIQRKLDAEAAVLASARRAHRDAQRELQAITDQLEGAVRTRARYAGSRPRGRTVAHPVLVAGIASRRRAGCNLRETARQQEVEVARTRVLVAREELNRMNSLVERILATNRIEAARRDRRIEDDMYAALAAPARGSAGEAH